MLTVDQLKPQDFVGLSHAAAVELAARVLAHVGEQSRKIESQAQAIEFRDAKIASITFELRRLKVRQFAAKTERMNADQRQLFEETMAADQADLEAQLEALKAAFKVRVAAEVGGVILIIDAKNERAAQWYAAYGAVPLADTPRTLVMALATFAAGLKEAGKL